MDALEEFQGQLDEILALAAKIPAGPWKVGRSTQFDTYAPNLVIAPDDKAVAQIFQVPTNASLSEIKDDPRFREGLDTAEFIARARDLLPALAVGMQALVRAVGGDKIMRDMFEKTFRQMTGVS